DNLHLGVPRGGSQPDAIEHATELMAGHASLGEHTNVLDLGSGYRGPARFLAPGFGCRAKRLNVSRVEVEEAVARTRAAGLDALVSFDVGDFHELPYPEGGFDVVWSQDSLMYGADKPSVLAEARRVLAPGGRLVFTDILASQALRPEDRERLYARVRTPEMWDIERYLAELIGLGFKIERVEDWSAHVAATYAWAAGQAESRLEELAAQVGRELVESTLGGLAFWVDMAQRGHVGWALFVAR